MSYFFKNNRNLILAGTALAFGGAMLLAHRYRTGQKARDDHASGNENRNTPRPITGHWIGTDPVLPSHISSDLDTTQHTAVSDYLTKTHMNMQHVDMETLQKRAFAHQMWGGAENKILDNTRAALWNHESPHFQMSSHMVHNERRLLADRADQMRETLHADAGIALSKEVTRMTTERAQGMGPAYDSLTDMIVHGKRGPLTVEQSALGVEATIVGHHVLDKTSKYAKNNPRMQATRPIDPLNNKPSHPTTSRYGMDLSQDPGTQMRESLGLPVMTGTSGSASDVIRSYNFTTDALSQSLPDVELMSAKTHREVLHDLTFNWMRRGVPMENVRTLISKHQSENQFQKMTTPLPTATQTHSYPEIVAGVDLTLDGNTTEHLRSSTQRAMDKMKQHL
jgi:hypothetical protein